MIYVLAYPEFEPVVADSIARFRVAHEPERAKRVRPHITLMFGLRSAHPLEFVAVCEQVAERSPKIAVEFASSEVVYDPFEKTHKLFLMVSAGKGELIALHERLYEGPHRSELAFDAPYRPHMTIATHRHRAIVEKLEVADIGPFPVHGTIEALEVVELANNTLHSLGTITLQT